VILVDTTPLVALCDARDALHERALKDIDRVGRFPLVVTGPVLAESCFLLLHPIQRRRLRRVVEELSMHPPALEDERLRDDTFAWLDKYADHEPDWTDGYLIQLAARNKGSRIWTYDKEFSTIWRHLNGKRVSLFGSR
jgi:predicted nucleic acid-binding protein